MAYTTGSTFSLQTGYNLPPLIYPANGMMSSTRTGGIVSSSDPYTANITCAFMGDTLKQSKNYRDIIRSSAELTDLRTFVTNWYNKTVNYTSSGFYFINYKTNSIPRHI